MGLLLAAGAALTVVLGLVGLRLVTTTGLGDVEAEYEPESARTRAGGFAAVLDATGTLFLRPAVRLYGHERLQKLDRTIRRAGRPDGLTVTVYVRRETGFVVIGFLLFLLLAAQGQVLLGALAWLILGLWMRLWLLGASTKRQQQIDADLPDFLDVLGVTVSAGLGFRQAVERVCEFHDSALSAEMRTALQEMSVGVTRRQAFVGLRERTRSQAVGSFVTALLQAEELGVPLAEALNSIAADVRREHAQQVRQRAARATPLVSLTVTLTILPGAMLLIISAVLMANAEVLSGLF